MSSLSFLFLLTYIYIGTYYCLCFRVQFGACMEVELSSLFFLLSFTPEKNILISLTKPIVCCTCSDYSHENEILLSEAVAACLSQFPLIFSARLDTRQRQIQPPALHAWIVWMDGWMPQRAGGSAWAFGTRIRGGPPLVSLGVRLGRVTQQQRKL
jgi:hypothetical protein